MKAFGRQKKGYKDPKKIGPCNDAYNVILAVDILSTVQEFQKYETDDHKKNSCLFSQVLFFRSLKNR